MKESSASAEIKGLRGTYELVTENCVNHRRDKSGGEGTHGSGKPDMPCKQLIRAVHRSLLEKVRALHFHK